MGWIARPFGGVFCGSLAALAAYYVLVPAIDRAEFAVAFIGSVGAAAGYGIERFLAWRRCAPAQYASREGEGPLNRQARVFLLAWRVFLVLAGLVALAALVDWTGIARQTRY
jgi:hypothetical protein